MSILVLRIPAHNIISGDSAWSQCVCAYISYDKRDKVERSGYASLADITTLIRTAESVAVLLSAVDVSLFTLTVPPLSAARLRAALPNLVEDKLLGDVTDSVIACSNSSSDGVRVVAVAQRAWLETLVQALRNMGARNIKLLSEQSCLIEHTTEARVAVTETSSGIALTLRIDTQQGMGLILNSADMLLTTLRAVVPVAPITLLVKADAVASYQALLAADALIKVIADSPDMWRIEGNAPNLVTGMSNEVHATWNWQPWRWSIALASAVLIINIFALNMDWWHMSKEASALRTSMKQIYLAAYPHETVILDPLLQMRQKVAAAQGANDEFSKLVAEFGQAWASVRPATMIESMEFHEQLLTVRLKSSVSPAAMQTALSARHIALESSGEQTWLLRSTR